jgi:ABC-type transport system involved in multi-copper enzyme maturation permease subunit
MWRDPALVVLRRELGANARGVLAWWLPIAGVVALVCALQPSLASGLLAAKLEAMPEAMRRAFGMAVVDFHRPAAYLATNFLYVALSAGVLACRLGAAAIAREEALRTAELLYTQPVTRARILGGKAAAVALYAVGFPLALAGVAIPVLGAVADRPVEAGLVASLFGGAAAVAVCFAGLGMLIAATVRDARAAGGIALAAALGTWFVGLLSALAPAVAPLRWLSPYKLLEPVAIVAAGGLDPVRAGTLVAAGAAAGALAIARYRRRDLLA